MVGIIIAMKSEAPEIIKKHFSDSFMHQIKKHKFYVIKTLTGRLAVISFCGIGKVNASAVTTLMINNFNIRACFNIGSCGIINDLTINEPLLVQTCSYCDVDATAFGYEINQVPHMPAIYLTDEKLNSIIMDILKSSENLYKKGGCYTSDSFVNKNNYDKYNFTQKDIPLVCDMECTSIAQVCHLLNVPFCAIKIGVDKLHEPENNQIQFKHNLEKIARTIETIGYNCIQALSYYLMSIDQKEEQIDD